MAIIKKQAEVVLASDDLSGFQKAGENARLIGEYEWQIKQLSEQRQLCYEQFVCAKLDNESFQAQKAGYSERINMLNNQVAVLKRAEHDRSANEKVVMLAKTATSGTATPSDIVDALVEKVFVFPNDHLEIRWKFDNFANGM